MNLKSLKEHLILHDFEIVHSEVRLLIEKVLERIPENYLESFPSFSIYQGSAEGFGYVTPDYIVFDPDRLFKIQDQVIQTACIAIFFAHFYLDHGYETEDSGPFSHKQTATKELILDWGFSMEWEEYQQWIKSHSS